MILLISLILSNLYVSFFMVKMPYNVCTYFLRALENQFMARILHNWICCWLVILTVDLGSSFVHPVVMPEIKMNIDWWPICFEKVNDVELRGYWILEYLIKGKIAIFFPTHIVVDIRNPKLFFFFANFRSSWNHRFYHHRAQ